MLQTFSDQQQTLEVDTSLHLTSPLQTDGGKDGRQLVPIARPLLK